MAHVGDCASENGSRFAVAVPLHVSGHPPRQASLAAGRFYAQQLAPPFASRPGLRLVAINTNLYSAEREGAPWSPFALPQAACSLANLSARMRERDSEEASRPDGVTAATPDFRATGGAKP